MKINSLSRLCGSSLAILVTVSLGGCVTDFADDDNYVSNTPGERFPIEYAKGPVTLQVETNTGSLEPSQINAVAGFARQSMSGGLTPVVIRRPSGGGQKMAQEIAYLMMQQGLPKGMVRIGSYPAAASAPIQISYVKAYAHTKPCGVWDDNLASDLRSENYTNFGCAVQSNMAAMIANPNDLVAPEPTTPGLGEAKVRVINRVGEYAVTSGSSGGGASTGGAAATP